MQLPLTTAVQVTLDGNGAGSIFTGPTAQGEIWTVSVIGVRCATNVNESICQVYLGSQGATGYLIGTTTWGSTGDSDTDISFTLAVGQVITAVWTGADPSTTAFLSIVGTRTV